jgi:hypothetical protein
MTDRLAQIGAFFFVLTAVASILVVLRQYTFLQTKTYRLVVLCTRISLFFPLCAMFMLISLASPSAYVMMMFIITIIEGYGFLCFLVLILTNLGGPLATVELMETTQRKLVCYMCFPSNAVAFYQRTTSAQMYSFIGRSVLSFLAAMCFYADSSAGRHAYSFFNAISTVVLIYAVLCLVNLCMYCYLFLTHISLL